jgi:hypothetical protein
MIIHNPILTGSFTVNGTDVASITSSAASLTSLNAYTASQNNRNGTYATTGSNTFAGVQTVNSNLVVTGSITAQTLVVQTVTSSVVYSSGSNVFGNNIANTQVLTGSVTVTGSLAVVTNGTEFQVNANGVNLGNALTDSHVISGSVRINPNGLFVSSSGDVGIGITDLGPTGLSLPATSNYAWSEGSGNAYAVLFRQRSSAATVMASGYKRSNTGGFASSYGISMARAAIAVGSNNGSIAFFSDTATNVANGTDITPTERMTIINSGKVGIGTTNPEYSLHISGSQALLKISSTTATFGSPSINLFQGAIDTVLSATNNGLEIGTWSAHDIILKTTQVERVRISSSGVKFQNGASSLNYYEEGTWTPAFGGAGSPSYSTQFGRYTRIGNMVYCTIALRATGISGGSTIQITGLPFSAGDASDTGQRATFSPRLGGHINGVTEATARFRVNGNYMDGVKGDLDTTYMSAAQFSSGGSAQITGQFWYYV